MARPIKVLWASEEVRSELRRRANGRSTEHRDRFRAKIILLRLDGMKIKDVAARMSTSMRTVSIWSSRFEQAGLEGLADKGGRGRKPSLPAAKVARVITEVTRPPKSRSRWSVRSMGRHVGISHSTVQRIWAKNDLKPHVTKTFKLSNDPKFEARFAPDRRQLCNPQAPEGEGLARAASALQDALHADELLLAVERFFADLTEDVIRSGSFASVNELVRDIKAYLAERNADPKPYAWRAEGAEILAKIKRARAALDAAQAVM